MLLFFLNKQCPTRTTDLLPTTTTFLAEQAANKKVEFLLAEQARNRTFLGKVECQPSRTFRAAEVAEIELSNPPQTPEVL